MTTFNLGNTVGNSISSYTYAISKRNKKEADTLKLLSTTFDGKQAEHLMASALHVSLSPRMLQSMTQQGASTWILQLLKGESIPCPIDKSTGLYGHPSIQIFIKNQDTIVKDCAKQLADKKAKRLADKEAKELKGKEVVNNAPMIGDAPKEKVSITPEALFADWLTLSDADKLTFTNLINAHRKAEKAVKVAA